MAQATKLTDTHIKGRIREAAASKTRLVLPGGERGLRLRITPAGTCTWALMTTQSDGKQVFITLGGYPAMGISAARQQARTTREQVRQGATPTADRKQAREIGKAERAGVNTLDDALDKFAPIKRPRPKLYDRDVKTIRRVFAHHLETHLSKLKLVDLRRTIGAYPSRATAAFAGRTLRPVLKWAASLDYCDPALATYEVPAIEKRQRRLLPDELRRLIPVLRASKSVYAVAHLLILLTACRAQEIGGLKWTEIDNGVLHMARVKGTDHVAGDERELHLKLPSQAVALLAGMPRKNEYVFGSYLTNWDRPSKVFQAASGTSGWHRHDLRRPAATGLGKLGYGPHLSEALLNHAEIHSRLSGIYNTARYRDEVAEALQKWADALDAVVAGDQAVIDKLR
jgi:integrase